MRANKDKPRHKRGMGKNSKNTPQSGGSALLAVHPLIRDLVIERMQLEAYEKANKEANAVGHHINPDLPTSDSHLSPAEQLERISQDPQYDSTSQLGTSDSRADYLPPLGSTSSESSDS